MTITKWMLVLFSLILVLAQAAAMARGPEGGTISSMAVSASDPDIIYVGTRAGGVFKSTDGGDSWQPKDRGFPTRSPFFVTVFWIAVNPNDANKLYAVASGSETGIFKSTNGGDSWEEIRLEGLRGSAIVTASGDANTLYAVAGQSIFRSTDGGEHWERRGRSPGPWVMVCSEPQNLDTF